MNSSPRQSCSVPPADHSERPSAQPVVCVSQLQKTYASGRWFGRRSVAALRGVSLQAHAGDVFGLLGPNGAGKTTLIKILLGVVRPSGGTATLFGRRVGDTTSRLRVGYLPESLRIDRHHTARSALWFYGRLSRMSSAALRRRSDELLELVGLSGRDRESIRNFSKGMYQRLGLAQALMHDPDLLVLDEPTDGLDPVGRNEVRGVIERLRDSGKTIFLNSHILQEVELVCTRVAILSAGQLRGSGTLDEIIAGLQADSLEIEVIVDPQTSDPIKLLTEAALGMHAEVTLVPASRRHADGPTYRITLAEPQQSQVDCVVDRLRGAGLSIARLESKRMTLEAAFMQLVQSTAGGASVEPEA